MTVKRLFLLCSLSVALLAPGAAPTARQKAGPAQASRKVRLVLRSMARSIEVYTSSGSLKGAMRHVQVVGDEVAALTYILPADNPVLNSLEVARNSLMEAAVISEAYRGRRRIPEEDMEHLSPICEKYGIPPGRGGRLQAGECVKVIMREARKRHREAVSVASREGVYKP